MSAGGELRRGSRNGASKLTEAKVREIRSRYVPCANGKRRDPGSTIVLAREFGVNPSTIKAIAHGVIWGWLD